MKYENQSLCSTCGGKCCKNSPCFFMPQDFTDLSFEGILREFSEKDYLCIRLDRVPRITMRSADWGKTIIPFFTRGRRNPCMVLTPNGCPFSYEERPTGGKLLVPDPNQDCKSKLTLEEVRVAWKPYEETLWKVASIVNSGLI